jgi:hypothetical protein
VHWACCSHPALPWPGHDLGRLSLQMRCREADVSNIVGWALVNDIVVSPSPDVCSRSTCSPVHLQATLSSGMGLSQVWLRLECAAGDFMDATAAPWAHWSQRGRWLHRIGVQARALGRGGDGRSVGVGGEVEVRNGRGLGHGGGARDRIRIRARQGR